MSVGGSGFRFEGVELRVESLGVRGTFSARSSTCRFASSDRHNACAWWRVERLGFRDWGLGFRVSGLGFEVWDLGFVVWGLGFVVWALGRLSNIMV